MDLNSTNMEKLYRFHLRSNVAADWFKIVKEEVYIEDLHLICKKDFSGDVESFVEKYTSHLGNFADAIYECCQSYQVRKCKTEKVFLALDKASIELAYQNYVKDNFYSSALEMTVMIAFIGHEFESFQLWYLSQSASVFGSLFNNSRTKALQNAKICYESMRMLYDSIRTPEISVDLLNGLISSARAAGYYVHPNVSIILERARDQNVRRFRRV